MNLICSTTELIGSNAALIDLKADSAFVAHLAWARARARVLGSVSPGEAEEEGVAAMGFPAVGVEGVVPLLTLSLPNL